MEYLKQPFAIGLEIGLFIALVVWIGAWWKRRSIVKENRTLKQHLHTQMDITARGHAELKNELEELRKQNENLRVTNATLNQKPGRAELHTLAVYDRAVHLMYEKAPGFAPAWEGVVREAEEAIKKTEKGLLPLIRKVFRPSLALPSGESPERQIPSGNTPANKDEPKESLVYRQSESSEHPDEPHGP